MRIGGNTPAHFINPNNHLNPQDKQSLYQGIDTLKMYEKDKMPKDVRLSFLDNDIGSMISQWHSSGQICDSTFNQMNAQVNNIRNAILNNHPAAVDIGLNKLHDICKDA